jgi:hypothetical protein
MAYVTFPVAQIISELRSTIMDRLHMGGSFLQQAPKVTIGGLPVAIRQGGLGSLGAALTGSLGALGGLSGLTALAGQLGNLKELANLPGIGDLKSLAGGLSGLGDSLGNIGELAGNLGNIGALSSVMSEAVGKLGDISQLGELSHIADSLGGLDALKDQLSQVASQSLNLSSLNSLTDKITTGGISELLQNPIAGHITDMVSKVDSLGNLSSGLLSEISSKIDSVSPGLSSTLNGAINTTLRGAISTIEDHSNVLSGIVDKSDTHPFGLNDMLQTGTNLASSLGVDPDTFIKSAGSALFSTDNLSSITNDINGNIIRGMNSIKGLTPDGGANDAIILATTNRLLGDINTHASSVNGIVTSDRDTANSYIVSVNSTSQVGTVANVINADGFSSLKGIVKSDYLDLVSYK